MYLIELNDEREIKNSWTQKRNALRKTEVTISDPGQLHSVQAEIEKINNIISEIEKKISSLEAQIKESAEADKIIGDVTISKETLLDIDISKAFEVLRQETKELNSKSSKEDIAKIHDLKTKLFEIFKDTDDQLIFVTSKKELLYSSVLFDKIYTSETIDPATVLEILKIRGDHDNYKWYDRSLLVSALSLSLINFKFDFKKANLLLDFITDFELNVWERALTGLTIAIIYQKNRSWLRDTSFQNRLKTLQNNDEIQEGLKLIDFILTNKIYEVNLFNPSIFKIELFQNPMNCFVPFFEDNEILANALSDASNDFELEEFKDYLNNLPFMDSYKYALCLGLSAGDLAKEKLEGEIGKKFNFSLNISNTFKPFQNLISEYYCFFKYFPKKLKDDVFEKQLLISNTDLRRFVLNKVNRLLLEGSNFENEEKYTEAINKFEDLLKIDKNHKEALWKLGNCFIMKDEIDKALKVYLDLESESSKKPDIELLHIIASCYNAKENFEKSNEYCDKIELEIKDPNFKTLYLKADNYNELNDQPNTYLYCQKAEKKASNEKDLFEIAEIYNSIAKSNDALRLAKKVLEKKTDVADYWILLAHIYSDLSEWKLALDSLKKAFDLNNNDAYTKLLLGRIYLLSKIDIEESRRLLEGLLKYKNSCTGIAFGNLGHLYLLEGNNDKAFDCYLKCIDELDDETDFNKKMEIDLPFITKMGINTENYNSTKNKVITKFKIKKNHT